MATIFSKEALTLLVEFSHFDTSFISALFVVSLSLSPYKIGYMRCRVVPQAPNKMNLSGCLAPLDRRSSFSASREDRRAIVAREGRDVRGVRVIGQTTTKQLNLLFIKVFRIVFELIALRSCGGVSISNSVATERMHECVL